MTDATHPDTPLRRASDQWPSGCPGICEGLKDTDRRFNADTARMAGIEESIAQLSKKLDENCADTAEVLDILRLGKSFFRLAGYASNVIKWVAGIGASVLVLYYSIRDWPKH